MPLYIYDNVSLMHMCAKLHQSYLTLCNPTDCSPPGSSVQDSSGKSTGVGCSVLFKGVFLTQGSNPCLLSPALAGGFFTTSTSLEALLYCSDSQNCSPNQNHLECLLKHISGPLPPSFYLKRPGVSPKI